MPPREPLIVQVPTTLSLVMGQVRREEGARKMNAGGRRILLDHIAALTKTLVPDVHLTNRSTKARLDLLAKVQGSTLFVVSSRVEKLVFAAGDEVAFPFVGGRNHRAPEVSPTVDEAVRKLIAQRLPRIRDEHRINAGLPEGTRAHRNEDGIQFIIEGLSDEGFKRVVEALRPLINLDRFNREDPI
jgi:hypothetical protein